MSIKAKIYKLLYPVWKQYLRIFQSERSGSGTIIRFGREVLLIKNTYGDQRWWSFPGGSIQRGENAKAAALREIKEEVGLNVGNLRELGSFLFTKYYRNDTIHVFEAEAEDKNMKVDDNEIKDAKWVPIDEVKEADLSDVGILMFRIYQQSSSFHLGS